MRVLYAAEFKKRFSKLPSKVQEIYRRQEMVFI